MKSVLPILRGFVTVGCRKLNQNPVINVYCPFCDAWHIHGYPKEDQKLKASHRAAHCSNNSPLYNTGYMIAPFKKGDLKKFDVEQLIRIKHSSTGNK